MADVNDIRFDIGILFLLRDENGAVVGKRIGELLRARREKAVPLILHSLEVSPNRTDGFDEPGQFMVATCAAAAVTDWATASASSRRRGGFNTWRALSRPTPAARIAAFSVERVR